MKTVVILIDQLYLHGGIEKLVAIKANYWSEHFGYKIIIVSTEQQNKKPIYKLSENSEFIDLKVDYDRTVSFFSPKNFGKLYSNIGLLKKVVSKWNPDFILVASHIPMTYLLPFLGFKAKIIKEFHFSKFNANRSIKERLFSAVEKLYDYLIILSEEEKTFYTSKNAVVIPNPVISLAKFPTSVTDKQNIAGAVLRFAPVKQIEKMVEIWEEFSENNQDWKLHIYGETHNDYFEEIQNLVQSKNLEKSIIFKGQSNNVAAIFAEIKILLMTSAQECFPLVILEANSCGVPVLSFDSPTGPRNIIKNNSNGILVPLNDTSNFVQELKNLSNNPEKLLAMSENSIKIAEYYLVDKVMIRWQTEIFEQNG